MRPSGHSSPIWKVCLAFGGPGYETCDGFLGSGLCTLTVQTEDPRVAWRAGLEWAKEELRQTYPGPEQYWSVVSVEEVAVESESELEFYRSGGLPRSEYLMEILKNLQPLDLRIEFDPSAVRVVAEWPDRFTVTIAEAKTEAGAEYRVDVDEWIVSLPDAQWAAVIFLGLLTPFHRVGKDYQMGELAAAWIERYNGKAWEPDYPMLCRNPSDPSCWTGEWTRVYLQQAVMPYKVPFEKIHPGADLDDRGFPPGTVFGQRKFITNRSMAEIDGWLDAPETFKQNGDRPGSHPK